MAEATEQLRIILTAQDNASAVVKNVGNTIQSTLANAVSGAAAGVGFAAFNQVAQSLGQAFGFAKDAIVGFNATLEQSRIAWSTMLGGGEAAESMLKRIQTFAASTPFSFPQVEQAARRFVAMGIAAGDVIPLMRSVGAAAIAVGGGADAVNRISLALGQMSTRTKVTAEDMMQLTEVGIPAWKILADATGQSVAQIQDSVTKGKVSADVMIAAFQNFAEINWAKLLDTQTFNTAVSNIEDNIRQLLAGAFEPLFRGLEDLAVRFEAFTKSAELQGFSQNVTNAQVAVGVFLQTVSQSGPILTVFQGALAGIAVVLGVQIVTAAINATAALAPLVIAFVVANAGIVALALAAAAAGVIIVASWDQISQATSGFVTAIGGTLGGLATWIGGELIPSIITEWTTGWSNLANVTIGALNAVGEAWNTFWTGQLGPTGQTAFQTLQEQASAGWGGFVDLALKALTVVLQVWNQFIGQITAVHDVLGTVGVFDPLVGKFADIDAIAKSFNATLRAVPGSAGGAFSAIGKFFSAELPAAIERAIKLVQAAGGDLSKLPQLILDELARRAKDLSDKGAEAGKGVGTAFGNGVVQAAKPLLEELARLLAQLAAGPATAALEDTQAQIHRAELVMADLTQAPEARAAALRQLLDLQMNVQPRQAIEAFDVNEPVRLAQRVLSDANLRKQIEDARLALAGQAPGGGPATVTATGAPTVVTGTGVPPQAPPPTRLELHIVVATPDGDTLAVYDELLEANGQAQTPPTIQVSAVRRN